MIEGESRSKLWWAMAAVAVLVALVVGGWALLPVYRHHKEERSLRLAREFFAKGDYRSGLLSLRQTLALNPNNPGAVLLMADFSAQAQSPAALPWWRRVVEISPTAENKALLAAVALRLERPPFPLTAQMLAELSEAGATNIGFQLLASQFALQMNRGDDAEAHLVAAAGMEPTNRMHQVNLATLRLQSRRETVVAAARNELVGLATDAQWGAIALRALITEALARTNAPAARTYSARLLQTTNATFADRIQDLNVLYAAEDSQLTSRLEHIQKDCGTNTLLITQTALWMHNHQRAPAALAWLTSVPPALRNVPPIALVEADCFIATRDWAGLEAQVSAQKWEEQDFFRLAYLARAFREQGGRTTANANWDRAVGAAQTRSERAGALVQLALNWGWREEALALLGQLSRRNTADDWPLQQLLRLYSAEQDTGNLQRVHEQLFSRHPDSLPIKNNFAMLSLLTRRDLPKATQLAHEVQLAGPTNGIYVSTYAFALHLANDSVAGLKLLEALPKTERLRPEVILYYALLLDASGDKASAKPLLAQVAKGSLLPEEKLLLEKLEN